jgi:hypothetical protein
VDFHLLIGTSSGRKELILADRLIVNDPNILSYGRITFQLIYVIQQTKLSITHYAVSAQSLSLGGASTEQESILLQYKKED